MRRTTGKELILHPVMQLKHEYKKTVTEERSKGPGERSVMLRIIKNKSLNLCMKTESRGKKLNLELFMGPNVFMGVKGNLIIR